VAGTSIIVRDTEDGGGEAQPGDEIELGAHARDVHLFDAVSSERLN
jgi:hypothetical protein